MTSILCFGDSNTYGLVPATDERYAFCERYPGVIQQRLGDACRVAEEGLVGRTTVYPDHRYGRRGIEFLPVCLETHAPLDYLVIMLGTNDCKACNARSAREAAEALEQLLEVAERMLPPQTAVVLVSPILLDPDVFRMNAAFDRNSVAVSRGLAREYEGLARRHGCLFLNAADYAGASPTDGQHMDVRGHRQLGAALAELIRQDAVRRANKTA